MRNVILSLINNGSSDVYVTVIDLDKIKNQKLVSKITDNSNRLITMYADDDEIYEEPTGEYKEILDAEVPFPCVVEGMYEVFYDS